MAATGFDNPLQIERGPNFFLSFGRAEARVGPLLRRISAPPNCFGEARGEKQQRQIRRHITEVCKQYEVHQRPTGTKFKDFSSLPFVTG